MLTHLVVRAACRVAWVAFVASAVGMEAATVRLLPWIVSPEVPVPVCVAFVVALALAALEVSLFVSLPLGAVLTAVDWVQDGTSKTLETLGVSPLRQVSNIAWVGVAFAALVFVVSTQSASAAVAPGRLSNELLAAASSQSCLARKPAHVPLLNVTWLCTDRSPKLVGQFPNHGPAAMVWTSRGAKFSDQLDRASLQDVQFALREPNATIHAKFVVVTGFVPWIGASTLRPALRGAATALYSLCAALASAWAMLRWPSASRARALVTAVAATLGYLTAGSFVLEVLTWWALPLLAGTAVLLSVAAGWVTNGRLPASTTSATKRRNVAVGNHANE